MFSFPWGLSEENMLRIDFKDKMSLLYLSGPGVRNYVHIHIASHRLYWKLLFQCLVLEFQDPIMFAKDFSYSHCEQNDTFYPFASLSETCLVTACRG